MDRETFTLVGPFSGAASQEKKCWFALRFLSRVNPLCGLSFSDLKTGSKVKPEYYDSQATLKIILQ